MKFRSDLQTIFLKPAELSFVRDPALIRTVLGSCVTVTMRNPRLHVAAACHPVLPVCRESARCRPASCRNKHKYVECVIPEMIKRFQEIGGRLDELEVKLFGGANMFSRKGLQQEILHVGSMNVSMARQKLAELELSLKSYDVGGVQGRKLFFNTVTGDVWVKKFQAAAANADDKKVVQDQIALQLKDYQNRTRCASEADSPL